MFTLKNENVAAIPIARNGIRAYKAIFEANVIKTLSL